MKNSLVREQRISRNMEFQRIEDKINFKVQAIQLRKGSLHSKSESKHLPPNDAERRIKC